MCGRWELARALDDVFGIQVTVRSYCKSCSIPNGKLLPNLSSSRLFLSAFHFHQPRKFPGQNLSLKKVCRRKPRQRGDWTGVTWSSQSRKTNFLALPDLAFGFVHKRSGNEIKFFAIFRNSYLISIGTFGFLLIMQQGKWHPASRVLSYGLTEHMLCNKR